MLKWLVVALAIVLAIGSKYAKRKLPLVPVNLEGKHFIVTGASAGIGKETVRTLAQWNASVVMAVRNTNKGNAVLEDIRASLGGGSIPVEVWEMDLAKFESVRAFAAKYLESSRPLDVLINNAGLVSWDYIITEDGHELTHQTNHLGHFLLTKLLMGPLQASAPSRVIQVSSEAHYMGKIDLDNLESSNETYNHFATYGNTKLMNVLFGNELNRRFKDSGVVSTSLHPGFVQTEFLRDVPEWLIPISKAACALFARDEMEGAKTQIMAATAPEYESVGGVYFDSCAPKQPNKLALDEALATAFWEKSEEAINKVLVRDAEDLEVPEEQMEEEVFKDAVEA
ncbi:hypothetical protein VYU27_003161 [Nannochloropsis oceanica]